MAAVAVVAVVLAAVLLAVSVYLVNYAIGRSGSGGDRDVALEVEASPDSVEAVIAANKAQCKGKIDAFTQENPGENLAITSQDGLTLHGVCYTHADADSHRWAIVLHGYRGDYTGALCSTMAQRWLSASAWV